MKKIYLAILVLLLSAGARAEVTLCPLFNSEGLPAWPFRTDSRPGITDEHL